MYNKVCNSEAWDIEKPFYSYGEDQKRAFITFDTGREEFPMAMCTLALLIQALDVENLDSGFNLKQIRSLSISNHGGRLFLSSKLISDQNTFLTLMSALGFDNSKQFLGDRTNGYGLSNARSKRLIRNDLPEFDLENANFKLVSTYLELQVDLNHIPSALFALSRQKNNHLDEGHSELNSLSIHMDDGKIILTHAEGEKKLQEAVKLLRGNPSHDEQTPLMPLISVPVSSGPVVLGKRHQDLGEKEQARPPNKRSKRQGHSVVNWSLTTCTQKEKETNCFVLTNDKFRARADDLIRKRLINFMQGYGLGYHVHKFETKISSYTVEIDEVDFRQLQQERPGINFCQELEKTCQSFMNRVHSKRKDFGNTSYKTYTNNGLDIALVKCPDTQLFELLTSLRFKFQRLGLKKQLGITIAGKAGFELLLIARQRLPKGESLAAYLEILDFDSALHTDLTKQEVSSRISAYIDTALGKRIVCKQFIKFHFLSANKAQVLSDIDLKKEAMKKEVRFAAYQSGMGFKKRNLPFTFVEENDELYCCFSEDLFQDEEVSFSQFLGKLGIKWLNEAERNLDAETDMAIEVEEPEEREDSEKSLEEREESEESLGEIPETYLNCFSIPGGIRTEVRAPETKNGIPTQYCSKFSIFAGKRNEAPSALSAPSLNGT